MIQMTQEQFKGYGAENISEIAAFARPYLEHRIDLYKKYARKLNENQFMGEGDAGKIVVAFEYYIVNMVQGYLGGKSPMYSVSRPSDYTLSKNERGIIQKTSNKIREAFTGKKPRYSDEQKKAYVDSFSEAIEYIRRYNDDAATYVEIVHDYLITTAAYLYAYENEDNEIVYTRFDSKQTAAVYDYAAPPNMIGIVRMWKEKDMSGNDIDVIELIDDSLRRKFVDRVPQEPEELHWNDVPCVAFENPDGIAVFEPALETITAYETNLGNIRSMTKYNDEAKLVFIGYRYENDLTKKDEDGNLVPNPDREIEEEIIMRARSLCIDGADSTSGSISWLIKDVNYDGILGTLKQYHDLITMVTGVPNMTDEAFSNADNASALGYKLYALDQYCATFDRIAKKALLRLWELITGRLNLKGENFDFRDIDIKLQRNIPTDRDKSLSRAIEAYRGGLISQETAINESQIEVDAKDEMERQKTEQEEDFETMKKRNEELRTESEEDGDEEQSESNQDVLEDS